MIVTRESDYALRILRNLAGNGKAPVSKICEAENIPNQFAYKILKKLERAEFVESYRGVNGGYRMTKTAGELTLYDVLTAMGSKMFVVQCIQEEYCCPNNNEAEGKHCNVHHEMQRLQDLFEEELKAKTLEELFA